MSLPQPMLPLSNTQRPFYETVDLRIFLGVLGFATCGVSLWFLTAASVHVISFPADSLFYARQLPLFFWIGLASSIVLLFSATLLKGRTRVITELFSLFLLSGYVIGLSSFVYENPRILDVYVHMSNTLLIVSSQGWIGSTDWYVRQFPGAYSYLAQFIVVAGISPFDLMKYYPVVSSWIVTLFLYTLGRRFNPGFAGKMTALSIGGFWFQLHLCPQSLELIPYVGLLYVLTRVQMNPERQKLWMGIAIGSVPIFVVSHPESDVVMMLGVGGLIILSRIFPGGRRAVPVKTLRHFTMFLFALIGMFAVWWITFANEARIEIGAIAFRAIGHALAGRTAPPTTIPVSPAYSYQLAILLEQGISVTIWLLGLVFFFLSRARWTSKEYPVWALFLAAVSTVVVTFQVRADMLQRSYLFSLLPAVIVFGAVMANRRTLSIRGRSLYRTFNLVFLLAIIIFVVVMPLTRNGVDPYEYTPQSSAYSSSVAAALSGSNSVLFLANGENAWRYFSALYGDRVALRQEQPDMTGFVGGFTKTCSEPNTGAQRLNIPLTPSDRGVNYVVLSDFYGNLYTLRYGPEGSIYYVDQKGAFESQVALHFNLVYSAGTDRIYANPNPITNPYTDPDTATLC